VTTPLVLVATWRDGLFAVTGETLHQEFRNQSVRALAPDGRGGALAIVGERSLRRRAPNGVWSTIATTELDLAYCVAVGDVIYVGTATYGLKVAFFYSKLYPRIDHRSRR